MNRTPISEIKAKAKDNLLGNYKIAIGSFALLFVIIYGLMAVLMGAVSAGISPGELASGTASVSTEIESFAISAVSGLFAALLSAGYTKIMMDISYGHKPKLGELFYCFKNHPDKAIIMFAILFAIQEILLIPSYFVDWSWENLLTGEDGARFLLWLVLVLTGYGISIFVNVVLGFCYLVYIEDPNLSVKEILICAKRLMDGNKLRYVYLFLSFIGYYVLAIFSLGISMLFTAPYQSMATVELYKDALNYADCRNRIIPDTPDEKETESM